MKVKKTKATPDLAELRERYRKIKEEGELQVSRYVAHMKKMEEYYSDWEDRLYAIEKEIQNLEEEHGITADKVTEYDIINDFLS